MKNYINILPWVLLSLLAGFFLFSDKNVPDIIEVPGEVRYDTISDTVYITKEIPKVDTVYLPSEKELVELWREIIPNVDTSGIILDYFSTKIVNDTIIDDSTLFVFIQDTLFLNEIKGRSIKVRRTEIVKTIKIEKIRDPLKAYAGMNYNTFDNQLFIGATLAKGRWLGTVDYGISNKSFLIGVKYQIKFK